MYTTELLAPGHVPMLFQTLQSCWLSSVQVHVFVEHATVEHWHRVLWLVERLRCMARFHTRLVNDVLCVFARLFSDNNGHKMLYCHHTRSLCNGSCLITFAFVLLCPQCFICKAKPRPVWTVGAVCTCNVLRASLGVVFASFVSLPVLMQLLLYMNVSPVFFICLSASGLDCITRLFKWLLLLTR